MNGVEERRGKGRSGEEKRGEGRKREERRGKEERRVEDRSGKERRGEERGGDITRAHSYEHCTLRTTHGTVYFAFPRFCHLILHSVFRI
jgi:hypothetical protein